MTIVGTFTVNVELDSIDPALYESKRKKLEQLALILFGDSSVDTVEMEITHEVEAKEYDLSATVFVEINLACHISPEEDCKTRDEAIEYFKDHAESNLRIQSDCNFDVNGFSIANFDGFDFQEEGV